MINGYKCLSRKSKKKKTKHGCRWTRDLKIGWFVKNDLRDSGILYLNNSNCFENNKILEKNSKLIFGEINFGIINNILIIVIDTDAVKINKIFFAQLNCTVQNY